LGCTGTLFRVWEFHQEPVVAKKKDSMALFEVISKSREKRSRAEMGVPEWMGDSEQGPAEQAEASTTSPQPGTHEAPRKPAIVKTGEQLQVTVNYLTCLAVALGLIVLLAGAFWLGRGTAPKAGEPAQAGMQAEVRHGLLGQGGKGSKSSKTGAKRPPMKLPTRQKGKYYLVIESTGGVGDSHLKHARKIQEFCYFQGGEPSEVRKYPATAKTPEQYVVWSLTPFDSYRSEEATHHAKVIEDLGAQYFAKYGEYRFQQRKKKDAQLDPWYLLHR
jgi:hypothetical protein